MSLLGFLAAGSAQGYANAKNAQTEQRNKMEMMLIQQDMQEMYQQRRDERMAQREDATYQRDVNRKDFEYTRGRGDKLEDEKRERSYKQEDFDMASKHDLNKLRVKHGYDASLEGMRQSGLDKRAVMKGLLNTSKGGNDVEKSNEADHKRLFDIQTKMYNDDSIKRYLMASQSRPDTPKPQAMKFYENEIERLRRRIASRFDDEDPEL